MYRTFHMLFTFAVVVIMYNWRPVAIKLAVILVLCIVVFTG